LAECEKSTDYIHAAAWRHGRNTWFEVSLL